MKSSTQVILPFLVLAGMLNDAQGQGCGGLSRRQCFDTPGCGWAQFGGCVPTIWSAQATLFDVIPSDSDAHDDYELRHKGRPDQEGYVVDVDTNIDSNGHIGSGDDVSDYEYDYEYENDDVSDEYDDLYLYEDEDMDKDEDIKTDFSSRQNTHLRGSASRNIFFSAVSVGGGSRPACHELSIFPNRCRARSDCRFARRGKVWCTPR